jgi:hypothetical protein
VKVVITDRDGLSAYLEIYVYLIQVNQPPSTTYDDLFVDENTTPGTIFCKPFQVPLLPPHPIAYEIK